MHIITINPAVKKEIKKVYSGRCDIINPRERHFSDKSFMFESDEEYNKIVDILKKYNLLIDGDESDITRVSEMLHIVVWGYQDKLNHYSKYQFTHLYEIAKPDIF